jgi:hypothetical protein
MPAQIVMRMKTNTRTESCSCGCAPCDQTSCSLDCAVQPRYFCGQLLTDADLTAGITWSQSKFRLGRRRDGWGVVCGLDVTCGPEAGMVTARPGYAVDCCGNDIVICADAQVDLNKLFQQTSSPCDPPQRKPAVEIGKQIQNGEEVVVDLALHYREEQIIPTTTLGRAACGQAGECEYSRVKESYQLTGKMIRRKESEELWKMDPLQASANNWVNELRAELEPLRKGFLQFSNERDLSAEKIQPVVRNWLEAHPIYQFCWLSGFISSTNPQDWLANRRGAENYSPVPELLFLVMQDRVNRFLAPGCLSCEDEGVPLARLWLNAKVSLGRTEYDIQQISPLPPYRRGQSPDRLPAPLGSVNRGEVIWRNPEDGRAILARYDIRLRQPVPVEINDDLNTVFGYFQELWDNPFLKIGEDYQPVVYRDRYGGDHLVGLREYQNGG